MKTVIALLLALASAAAGAQAWDAAAEFRTSPWSYGWRMPGAADFIPMQERSPGTCGAEKLTALTCVSKWGQSAWPLPQIGINATGAPIDYQTGGSHMVIPVAAVNMRPDIDGGMPVLRWTAPEAGDYILIGSAQLIDRATGGAVVHVTGLREKAIEPAFGAAKHFTVSGPMDAGQSVDFAVEAVGFYFYASTALRVTVLKR